MPLCIFDKNLTKELFVHMLQSFLLTTAQILCENDWWLQQDNDSKHTAHGHELNPVENIGGHMKQQMYQKAITDVEEMKWKSTKMWDAMMRNFLQTFVTSMPAKINACTDRQGGKIDC